MYISVTIDGEKYKIFSGASDFVVQSATDNSYVTKEDVEELFQEFYEIYISSLEKIDIIPDVE